LSSDLFEVLQDNNIVLQYVYGQQTQDLRRKHRQRTMVAYPTSHYRVLSRLTALQTTLVGTLVQTRYYVKLPIIQLNKEAYYRSQFFSTFPVVYDEKEQVDGDIVLYKYILIEEESHLN
jgi:hypothetical protein